MPQVTIPDELFRQVEQGLEDGASASTFVVDAVREKLRTQRRQREFFRLSDETYRTMLDQGFTEADILADFESFRTSPS